MKKAAWIILSMFVAHSLGAQITFERLIGGQAFTAGECVIETSTGEYVVTGQISPQGFGGPSDLYLVKTDTLGDTLWTRSYGGADDDSGNSVVETSDGGYAICGTTKRFDGTAFQIDVFLVRTDANGDSLWTRYYGGNLTDQAYCIQQTFDDGFILVGVTESFGNSAGEAYIIRTDPVGDVIWVKEYSQGYSNRAFSVKQTQDGGFILCGRSQSSGSGTDADLYMLRINSTGDSLWAKTFGGTGFEEGNSVIITPDNGFLAAGYTQTNANKNIYLVKTDSAGASGWTKSIGGQDPEEAFAVARAPGGGFLLAGTRVKNPSWFPDAYILKVDGQGDTVWTQVYGGSRVDAAKSIQPTADGGMIIAGQSDKNSPSGLKLYLLKADASGVVSLPPVIVPGSISLYPNPLSEFSVLEVPLELARIQPWLEIYDLQGRLACPALRIQQRSTRIGSRNLPAGMYIYQIVDEKQVYQAGRVQVKAP